jgi:hypothetical protein
MQFKIQNAKFKQHDVARRDAVQFAAMFTPIPQTPYCLHFEF